MISNSNSLRNAIVSLTGQSVRHSQPVSGGDINAASLLTLSDGTTLFLKENRKSLSLMFAAEADGLEALRSVREFPDSCSPPVPKPLAWGTDQNRSFLLIETVEGGSLKSARGFGTSLAALHRLGRSRQCGFHSDNWIGSTPQSNTFGDSWHDFFAHRRLEFQWKLAVQNGFGDSGTGRAMQSVLSRLSSLLPEPDGGQPSLLHGDLWGGNWMAGSDGRAWLIDPAVYYGHREADLAMTQLFGGFPAGFFEGYQESWPLEPGFPERKDLYNLYHLLNHLNLFGGSYYSSVRSIIRKYE